MNDLRNIKHYDLSGKTILYRSPYDIGTMEVDGEYKIKDDSRIKATLPTLNYLLQQNCKVVILTWVGRPDGFDPALTTEPHAIALSKLLDHSVQYVSDCIGEKRQQAISEMEYGDIIMLENTRFYEKDEADDREFAEKLTEDCDFIVYDGFPQAHRVSASTTGILSILDACSGFYMDNEYEALQDLLNRYRKPFTLIIGGAKASDKTEALYNLYDKVDQVLVGGGPANVFLKSRGVDMSSSLVDEIDFDDEKVDKIQVPTDLVIGDSLEEPKESEIFSVSSNIIPKDWAALDIGPQTAEEYSDIIQQSNTVFWAGPMGMFENEQFAAGTKAIAEAISNASAKTIVGGGDTVEALNKFGAPEKIDHVSLAGGATLDFLAGKKLPVIELLKERN